MNILEIGLAIFMGGAGIGFLAICIAIAYMFFKS